MSTFRISTMRMTLLAACVAAMANSLAAHHSFAAEFDSKKPIAITGTIAKLDWINPHANLYLDAKDDSGKVVRWTLQTLPPSMLIRRGVKRDIFSVGQTVTVSGFAAKDETQAFGWVKKVQFADGKVLQVTAEAEEK